MDKAGDQAGRGTGRLAKAERRRQLLDTALAIVREEGADRLTLGHLAARAGVSKPIAYEHFGTRAALLAELLRAIDARQAAALREALSIGGRSLAATADLLAGAYIHCAAATSGEWHAIGAALSAAGGELEAVHRELLDGYARLFASALRPCTAALPPAELERRCAGLIGAAEALSLAMLRGACGEAEAARSLAALIEGGLRP